MTMLRIPNILLTSVEDFIDWSVELAEEHISQAPRLREVILNSNINNKEFFSIKDDNILIQYVLLCLAYGQLEPGVYQDPHYKSVITTKISTIFNHMSLENKGIAFITSIEEQVISALTIATDI
ncbi:hypothetical protein [Pseudomonas moraviensis]|uniref:hypothetical protein n=1 Tax=Pseudomonas moraviensis TaxID=321662 RepID=UPI0011477183|nr:hypothetical protein [Pseudomonas moraviensis]